MLNEWPEWTYRKRRKKHLTSADSKKKSGESVIDELYWRASERFTLNWNVQLSSSHKVSSSIRQWQVNAMLLISSFFVVFLRMIADPLFFFTSTPPVNVGLRPITVKELLLIKINLFPRSLASAIQISRTSVWLFLSILSPMLKSLKRRVILLFSLHWKCISGKLLRRRRKRVVERARVRTHTSCIH